MEFGIHEKYNLGKRFTFCLILLNLLFFIQFMALINYVPDYGYAFNRKVTIKATNHCQSSGLITVGNCGRLGNQLSQYASLLAASKVINATPVISEVMRKKLVAVFPYFTFPVLNCLNHSRPIKWTHIKTGKIQNLTTPISKQTLKHYLHSSNTS